MPRRRQKDQGTKNRSAWPLKVFFITFFIALVLSLFSETTLLGVTLPVAILVLFFIVSIGVLFDIIGIAVTFQDDVAYSAMASKRIRGAKNAVKLVRSASLVSNICNDVVGDICGIVSGAMGAAVSVRLIARAEAPNEFMLGIVISSLIAAVTVSAKALGKNIAVRRSLEIVLLVGKFFSLFSGTEYNNKQART
jgi:CBS domain containing-hemolysin-like protein